MSIALITGSTGLIGSQAVEFFADKGFQTAGIDNDMRAYYFGPHASTRWNLDRLNQSIPDYQHYDLDIRNIDDLESVFEHYSKDISVIIHSAAQPSHDWAAREPITDFTVNANGTLNLLELTRRHCPNAVFIFCSTNKVYGDTPNQLPIQELNERWELPENHPYFNGIDETMTIDTSMHSLFGASKVSADILVQEYGRYFNMNTVCFRGGCLTGPYHSGAELHGFLSYLMKCAKSGTTYTIFGYKGKQVRDNIHSFDLVNAFYAFCQNPRPAEVYNIGGGRQNSCSILEAIRMCESFTGKTLNHTYTDQHRSGDHIWYISSLKKFKEHYPDWTQQHSLESTLEEIHNALP